jgi:hypothetical protein
MNKEFVSYPEALALKELGFDGDCLGYYRNEEPYTNPITIGKYTTKFDLEDDVNFKGIICLAPLYQQAFKFFRDKYVFR